jgi:hypothetical protein
MKFEVFLIYICFLTFQIEIWKKDVNIKNKAVIYSRPASKPQ